MAIQKISGVNLNQMGSASKNVSPQQHLALPREISRDSAKFSQVSFKGEDCGMKIAGVGAAACIATGVGNMT